jgi:amidase
MCADLAFQTHMMQWCINRNAWEDDHKVIDMPWRDSIFGDISDRVCHLDQRNGNLVFAVLATDEELYPHPPVQRAMRIVTEALLQRGYEVTVFFFFIEWSNEKRLIAVPGHQMAATAS